MKEYERSEHRVKPKRPGEAGRDQKHLVARVNAQKERVEYGIEKNRVGADVEIYEAESGKEKPGKEDEELAELSPKFCHE